MTNRLELLRKSPRDRLNGKKDEESLGGMGTEMQLAFIFLSGTESYRRYAKWSSAGGVQCQGVSYSRSVVRRAG